jgi:glycosyltransferase involved in cell wall biosynthesis
MKVLVVLNEPPLPEGGAPGRCAVGLIRGLRSHGVDVRAIAARRHFSPHGQPPDDLGVEVVDVAPPKASWRFHVDRVRRPLGELGGGEFLARVQEAAAEVDVVHLDHAETSWSDTGVTTPSLVHLHYRVLFDQPLGRPWERRFRQNGEFALLERAAIRRHRHLVANSDRVARSIRSAAPVADVVTAPLSLDLRYYEPAPLDGPPVAGIIGTATWGPTRQAIERLVSGVWPLVRRAAPEAWLLLAGRDVAAVTRSDATLGVEVLGEVASSAEFLRSLSVLVYPVLRGSGMKVKVMEAMASGVPVVTTPAGAEGIASTDGVVVAADDRGLADAAARLLADPDRRRKSGAAARATFERHYEPSQAVAPLLPLYERMVERR